MRKRVFTNRVLPVIIKYAISAGAFINSIDEFKTMENYDSDPYHTEVLKLYGVLEKVVLDI